jgi:cytochrome c oxidase subunit II
MDEQQQSTTEASKSNLNPLLIVVILIIVAAVGVMLWLGNNKNNTQSTQVTPTTTTEQTAPSTDGPTGTATESATEGAMTMEKAISVEGGNFFFKPNEIRVKKGEKVTITFTSAGGMHDFVIDEFNVKSETINSGSTTVEFTPDKAGTFEFYCGIGMHRKMGMVGKLIVE